MDNNESTGKLTMKSSANTGEVDIRVGEVIREFRTAHKLSLKDVCEATGLSIGHLSQIERGLSSPSLKVLTQLAKVFDMPVAAFFPNQGGGSPDADIPIMRQHQRPMQLSWREGITKDVVTPATCNGRDLVMYVVSIAPGGNSGEGMLTHDGEECGFVEQGTLRLEVAQHVYLLQAGDGFRFPSAIAHRFSNPSDQLTRVVWVNYREHIL